MINVLIVITSFRHGGTCKSLQNLSSFIDENSFIIDVFAMDHYGPYLHRLPKCNILKLDNWIEALIARFDDTKGVAKIRSFFLKNLRNICNYFHFDLTNYIFKKSTKKLSKFNYDVVVAFSEGVPTAFVSHFTISKKIAWVRCDYNSYLKINSYPDETILYQSFDAVVCVSKYTKEKFCECIPSMTGKVHSIYNVLDTSLMLSSANESIADNQFAKEQFNIVSIGRIDPVKRFSQIPQIVRTLVERGCVFKWYLIGPSGMSAELTEFHRNIIKFDVSNHFFWLGPINNPYPYIAQCNLLVNTSISEACPNVVNEAKILHTPVLCTDFGSAPEFIEDGFNGFITPFEGLSEKIELLIKEKEEYNKIKGNLSAFVYDNEYILKDIYNLLTVN